MMFEHRYKLPGALILLVSLASAGCSTLYVQTDSDPQAPVSGLKTYAWADGGVHNGTDPAVNSPLVGRLIEDAVDSTLAGLDYQKVATEDPDFRITYRIDTEVRSEVSPRYGYGGSFYDPYYGHGFGHGRFGYGFGHGRFGHGRFGYGFGHGYPGYGGSYMRDYLQGTVVLDIVDARTGRVIWRGWARKDLSRNPKPKDVRKYIAAAVHQVFEDFPRTEASARPKRDLVADPVTP